jgi:transcriptional regulator with XRE-family HTH domain
MTSEEQGSRRLAETLRRRLDAAGATPRDLERRLGWVEGTLSEALSGAVELKVKDLLALLQAAGIEERSFFGEVYDLEPRCRATSGQGEIPYSIGHLSDEDATTFPPTEEILALFRSLVHDSVRQDRHQEKTGRPGAPSLFDETDLLDGNRRGD